MNKETTIAIPADPNDPEDRDASVAGVERGYMARRIRRLRMTLGFSQESFSEAYGIPLTSLRQYEIARYMPPPAVRALFALIEADPQHAASVLASGDRWKPKEWAA